LSDFPEVKEKENIKQNLKFLYKFLYLFPSMKELNLASKEIRIDQKLGGRNETKTNKAMGN
jgi:hypothetical protein